MRTVFNTRHTRWLDGSSLEPRQVQWMKRETRNNCAARRATRKICVCAAYGEVFCLHLPSRARVSLMSVGDFFNFESAGLLQKGVMAQSDCIFHFSHNC